MFPLIINFVTYILAYITLQLESIRAFLGLEENALEEINPDSYPEYKVGPILIMYSLKCIGL